MIEACGAANERPPVKHLATRRQPEGPFDLNKTRESLFASTQEAHPWSCRAAATSYIHGMKTAVSIPDDVFEKVERFARRAKRSRSEVFSAALREYVARHSPDEVTEAINQVCDRVGDQTDDFVAAAARRILEKTEW